MTPLITEVIAKKEKIILRTPGLKGAFGETPLFKGKDIFYHNDPHLVNRADLTSLGLIVQCKSKNDFMCQSPEQGANIHP
jgi:hypothetical protein